MSPGAWLGVGCDGTDGLGDLGLDGGDEFPGRNSPAWELPWIRGAHFALPQVKFVSRLQEV